MNCRVPGPPNSASSRRRRTPKQTGSSQPSSGRREVQRPGLALQQGQVVHRVVEDLLAAPAPAVARHDAVADDDPDGVHRADDRDPVVGELGGHRVLVGVEADQRQRVDATAARPGRPRTPRTAAAAGPAAPRRAGRPWSPACPRAAARRSSRQPALEVGVERLQAAVDDGDRHQEVAAGVADQRLDVPLLVGPPHQAEVGLEQVMALEPEELVGDLAVAAAEDLGDGDLGVVVADPARDAAEEGEGPDVALEERLGALAREGADRRSRRSTAGSSRTGPPWRAARRG